MGKFSERDGQNPECVERSFRAIVDVFEDNVGKVSNRTIRCTSQDNGNARFQSLSEVSKNFY